MTKIIKKSDRYYTDKGVPIYFYDQNNKLIKDLPDDNSKD